MRQELIGAEFEIFALHMKQEDSQTMRGELKMNVWGKKTMQLSMELVI